MTPPASWRPKLPSGAFVIGPAFCHRCGGTVWFGRSMTRVLGEAVLGEVKAWREWGRFAVHGCAVLAQPKARQKLPQKSPANRYPMLANARAEWENRQASSSSESHRLPNDARVSATTRGAGVVAPIEVVAR